MAHDLAEDSIWAKGMSFTVKVRDGETRAGDTINFNVFLFNLVISQHRAGAL